MKATNDINMTSLQGYVTITYAELVNTLGYPPRTDMDKVTVEWAFKLPNGVVFTIYDYKEDVTPIGVYDWHIGGRDSKAVDEVRKLFPKHSVKGYR